MILKLELFGEPFAKQSFRFAQMKSKTGKTFMVKYQPKKVKDGERNLRAQIIQQLPKSFIPFKESVIVETCHFKFCPPKSFSKKKQEAISLGAIVPKLTKPDLTDNLMKGLFDAMKGIVFSDDSIVWSVNGVRKFYSHRPGIDLVLEGE